MQFDNYEKMFNAIGDLIFIQDHEGRFLAVNRAVEKMYGYPTDYFLGKSLLDLQVSEQNDLDCIKSYFTKCLSQDTEERFEYWAVKADGSEFIKEVVLTKGEFNGAVCVIAIGRDITDKKYLELELKKKKIKSDNLTEAFDSITESVAIVDAEDRLVFCSKLFRTHNYVAIDSLSPGCLFEEHLKVLLEKGVLSEAQGREEEWLNERMEKHRNPQGAYEQLHNDGRCFLLQESCTRSGGRITLALDITERKNAEQELLTKSQIISNMAEGALLIRTSDATIVYANPLAEKMFGYQSGEMLGMHMSSLHARANLTAGPTHEDIEHELKVNSVWRGEVFNVRKDGTEFWSSASVSELDHPEYGKVWVSVRTDITERKVLDAKVHYQASHDALTGLINRSEFEQRVTQLLSLVSNEKAIHAMCFLDLDQFKVINDTCGHAAGDELLRQLGRVLQETIRKQDTLARLGGDEFGVLMEHCTLEQAHRAADDILDAIKDYQFFWDDNAFRIGVSIGLVAITEASGNFTDVFKQADAACYLAKDLGRNRIHAYHPDDTELAVRHGEMQWIGRIHQALDDDRYCLYAQPIAPLDDSEHRHYEMLLRMIDENGKVIPPGAFLPAAERYDLISKLDRWVVENALVLLAENPSFVDRIHFISINLSGQSLTSGDFLDFIIEQIKNTGVAASKLCFEITETLAISNLVAARSFINILKDLGCQFALDDFGSGLSSFGYLKNLPVDYLKIDGVFVKDIVDDPIDHAMVKSINEIGQVMGMRTIAEFVENDEIKAMLGEIGVDYVQGYGIGMPLPFEEIVEQTYFRLS